MDLDFMRILREAIDGNRGVVLAMVVEARGSAPREAGAKMLIFRDGSTHGTVGGGAVEKRVMEEAQGMWDKGGTQLLSFHLKDDLNMECGGEVKIFLERVKGVRRLVIFGGGHIGHALYTLSPLLGMKPVIVDERPEFCNTERFPMAEVLPVLPKEALDRLNLGCQDYVVIVTHRHARDLECLRLVLHKPLAYLGMIGSKKKVANTLNQLKKEGAEENVISRVHAPIGLNLGGRTPGEIALSIAAEIIALSHGNRPHGFSW